MTALADWLDQHRLVGFAAALIVGIILGALATLG